MSGCDKNSAQTFRPDLLNWNSLTTYIQNESEVSISKSSIDFCNAYSTDGKTFEFANYEKSTASKAVSFCKRYNGNLWKTENIVDSVRISYF